MDKQVLVTFSEQANKAIASLAKQSAHSKRDGSLLRAIDKKVALLKSDPFLGQQIPRRLIPREYRRRGVACLYRLELPLFWRMLYTVQGSKIEIIAFVLDILDHKEYDRKFGY